MKENQIIDVDGFVHVVNGKVICFTPDVLDISSPEDRDYLVQLADVLYTTELNPPLFGKDSMEVLGKIGDSEVMSTGNMQLLPKDILQQVEVLINEFRSGSRRSI